MIAVAGCATGPSTGRNIKIGDMLPCEMISLKDGTKLMCEVQFTSSIQGKGTITAFNPVSKESFQGQYRVILTGGGSSTGVWEIHGAGPREQWKQHRILKLLPEDSLKEIKVLLLMFLLISRLWKVTPRMVFSFSFLVKERGLTTTATVTRFISDIDGWISSAL